MGLFVSTTGVYAAALVFPLIDTAVVGARFFVRRTGKTSLGGDDWTILAALILLWGHSSILIVGAALQGFGIHSILDPVTGALFVTERDHISSRARNRRDIDISFSANMAQVDFALDLVTTLSLGAIKLSVVLFFRRIFVGPKFRYWSIALCVFIGFWTAAFFFSKLFQCGTHVSAYWSGLQPLTEYCDNVTERGLAVTVTDVFTDVLVLVTPLPLIWNLQISRARKIAISGIFLLCLFSTASAILRMYWYIAVPFASKTGARDLIAINTLIDTWAQIEIGVALFAACLPTLRPLFRGSSPESILGSLRSRLSLNSLFSGKRVLSETEDSSLVEEKKMNDTRTTELLRSDVDSTRPPVKTEIDGHGNNDFEKPTEGIRMHSEMSFMEERV